MGLPNPNLDPQTFGLPDPFQERPRGKSFAGYSPRTRGEVREAIDYIVPMRLHVVTQLILPEFMSRFALNLHFNPIQVFIACQSNLRRIGRSCRTPQIWRNIHVHVYAAYASFVLVLYQLCCPSVDDY